MTMTTYDEDLCRLVEPDVCTTKRRYEVLKIFQECGIPTVIWLSPILPFLNDTEENLRGILKYCIDAGVKGIISFGFGTTIRDGDREYFYAALDRHFPGMKQKYINTYGMAYECSSPNHPFLNRIFHEECEKHGILHQVDEVFAYLHEFPVREEQLSLFD